MGWLLLTIISATAFSTSAIFQRLSLKNKASDPVAFTIIFGLIVSCIIFLFSLTQGFHIPNLIPLLLPLILMSLSFALGNSLLFRGTKITEASEVAVLFSSYSIWAIITSTIILHEVLTLTHIIGIILIIVGIIVISAKKTGWKLHRGHLFTLLAAFFFGLGFTLNAFFTGYIEVTSYLVIGFLFPAVALMILYPRTVPKLKGFITMKFLPLLIGSGIFYAASSVTILLAYTSGGKASQIVPISQSSLILTIILSYILLKEKENLFQKILGSIIVFVGIILLK